MNTRNTYRNLYDIYTTLLILFTFIHLQILSIRQSTLESVIYKDRYDSLEFMLTMDNKPMEVSSVVLHPNEALFKEYDFVEPCFSSSTSCFSVFLILTQSRTLSVPWNIITVWLWYGNIILGI